MRKISLIWFISVIPLVASLKGQEILTLKECYEKAYITSALAGERVAYSSQGGGSKDTWVLEEERREVGTDGRTPPPRVTRVRRSAVARHHAPVVADDRLRQQEGQQQQARTDADAVRDNGSGVGTAGAGDLPC